MNKNSSNLNLTINSRSWIKDTEDLFDFETDDTISRDFKISANDGLHYILSNSKKIFILDEKILILKDLNEVKKKIMEKNNLKILGEVCCTKNGQFMITNPFGSLKLSNYDKAYLDRLWIVLNKNEMRLIKEGDILKLGRVRLKVDKIVIRSQPHFETNYQNVTGLNYLKTNTTGPLMINNLNNVNNGATVIQVNQSSSYNTIGINANSNLNNSISNNDASSNLCFEKEKTPYQEDLSKNKDSYYICKICFRTDSDINDPLISPCKCAGSMGFIHYKCLKQCINVKINTKIGENYICHIWKNFECEICLTEYPKIIKYKNLIYNVVDLNISYEQYIILDYTLYDDSKKKSFRKGIIIVKVNDDEEISIGRTQTNTIKLKDISVSRVHCSFTKKDNNIYITDKGSKFGTLLYLNRPFLVTSNPTGNKKENYEDANISLISGKNLFSFKLTQSWNFFSNLFSVGLCCKCKVNNEDEFVLNIEEMLEENEMTKIKENNVNSNKMLNDSYHDYVLNLETIIKCNETSNNNNSFI